MVVERTGPRTAEVDARAIVPVKDEIGGVVVYVHGRPAYYVLNGEWIEAVGPTSERETRSEYTRLVGG